MRRLPAKQWKWVRFPPASRVVPSKLSELSIRLPSSGRLEWNMILYWSPTRISKSSPQSRSLSSVQVRWGSIMESDWLKLFQQWCRSTAGNSRESFPDCSQNAARVNMRRCEEFLGELRRQEHHLKDVQAKTTEELLQVQAARRAFEETLKEKLRAEQRAFGSEHWAELCSTKEADRGRSSGNPGEWRPGIARIHRRTRAGAARK